jgi:PKD repeat protein
VINYGDGTRTDLGPATGTGFALHHVYQSGNTYTVVLTATDSNGGVGTAVTTVFVQAATPLTVFLSATPTFGTTTTTESFTATVIGLGNSVVVNYQWDFGDGRSLSTSGNQVTQTYSHPSGPFTVRVTVTTSTAQTASGTTVIAP